MKTFTRQKVKHINSGATPNSLKVSAYALFLFFTAWDLATLSSNKWIHTCAVMLDCTLLLTLVVMWFSRWHHGHIAILHIQSYRYNQTHTSMQWCWTMVKEPGPGTSTCICTGTFQKLNRHLHRNPPAPRQVSASEPSGTSPGISTNMNWYKRHHVGWHPVTNCIWSCVPHHDIMRTLPYNRTRTITQSYTYKHAHKPCNDVAHRYVSVCDAFPWKVVQTHNVQVFALRTFVFIIRSCCWQNCL
jgi:hypothetical protein